MSSNQVSVSNHTSPDAGRVWPVGSCDEFSAQQPVFPNTTNSRVCGAHTTNATEMAACCNGAQVHQYQCWTYCSYPGDYSQFVRCLDGQAKSRYNDTSNRVRQDVFCEGSMSLNNTASLAPKTSFAFRQRSAPRIGWVLLVAVFTLLFVSPASAAFIPSLDDGALAKRQNADSQCRFTVQHNYTRGGRQQVIRSFDICREPSDGFCTAQVAVDTGMTENNRTINAVSAAEPGYDEFFGVVANTTGRLYPAMSSLEMDLWTTYSPQSGNSRSALTWVAFQWCSYGTATNCKAALGTTNDAQHVEACGPLFVGDPKSLNDSGAVIQGSFTVVVHN